MIHYAHTIDGWFSDGDCNFYRSAVDFLKSDLHHIVEIGSYKGKSASFMAVELCNLKLDHPVKFDCVDTWEGSEEHQKGSHAESVDVVNGTLYETFTNNMKPVEGYYHAVRTTSLDAAKLYDDRSLDLVFIDAAHDYDNVKADILAWLPKVRLGGIISGHDYCGAWPGVIQAVNELIQNPQVFTQSVCWYKVLDENK